MCGRNKPFSGENGSKEGKTLAAIGINAVETCSLLSLVTFIVFSLACASAFVKLDLAGSSTSLRPFLLRGATLGLGHHWCIWRSVGYDLQPSLSLLVCHIIAYGGKMRTALLFLSQPSHQISVHQRYPGDEKESLAVQYTVGEDDDHCGARSTNGKNSSRFQDALLIFGKDPSHRVHFLQHSLALMSERSKYIDSGARDSGARATPKGITRGRRKRDPKRPKGYVSGFNHFVREQTPAYVRETKVMHRSLWILRCYSSPPQVLFWTSLHRPSEFHVLFFL